ncbi:homocysteine S-methyltransferase family protein [bacterium]|nr:homocysteine S-methyltransferase family protein [bacterium]
MVTKSTDILSRLRAGDVIIMDGAFGTELERMRAVSSSPIWSAEVLDNRESLVVSIHHDYILAGAEIITTGTFRTTRRALEKVGRKNDYERLTRIAASLAREAIAQAEVNHKVYVAGSIAPLEDCYSPDMVPSYNECRSEHRIQVELMANSGVDIILGETFNNVMECRALLEAAAPFDIPIFLGVTCTSSGELLNGESLRNLVDGIRGVEPDCMLINCTPTHTLHIALGQLIEHFDGYVGAYGNVGMAEMQRWEFDGEISASSYVEFATKWVMMGAQIIGGCCGTNPEYIKQLKFHLPESLPQVQR